MIPIILKLQFTEKGFKKINKKLKTQWVLVLFYLL